MRLALGPRIQFGFYTSGHKETEADAGREECRESIIAGLTGSAMAWELLRLTPRNHSSILGGTFLEDSQT